MATISLEGGVGRRSKQGKNGQISAISGVLQGNTLGAVGVRLSHGMLRVVPAAISGPVASSILTLTRVPGGHIWAAPEISVCVSYRLHKRVWIGSHCSRGGIRVPRGASPQKSES